MTKLFKKILSYLIVIAVLLVLCFDWGQVFYPIQKIISVRGRYKINDRETGKGYKMKELRKKIEGRVLGLPEGIVKTDSGDLLVKKIGAKFVHVYNLHKQWYEKYALKDFAPFVLGENWKVEIFEEELLRAKIYYVYGKHEDNKNAIANRALANANAKYGLNGAASEDSWAWEKARGLAL